MNVPILPRVALQDFLYACPIANRKRNGMATRLTTKQIKRLVEESRVGEIPDYQMSRPLGTRQQPRCSEEAIVASSASR